METRVWTEALVEDDEGVDDVDDIVEDDGGDDDVSSLRELLDWELDREDVLRDREVCDVDDARVCEARVSEASSNAGEDEDEE